MKLLFKLFIAIVFISTNLFAQDYGLGNTDPSIFTKYRLPETNYKSLYFNSSLSFNSNKYVSSLQPYYSSSSYTSDFNSSLSPTFYYLKQNDERVLSINSYVTGQYRRNYNEQNGNYSNKTSNYSFVLNFSGDYKNYFNSGDLFYSVGSDMYVNISEQRQDNPQSNIHDHYYGGKTQSYNFSFGFGWGKKRNVTPVVTALRFQQRLKLLNLVDKDLSDKTIIDLAGQFSKEDYYNEVHYRWNKYFWDDVEKILQADGVSLDGINQYGNSFLRETPDEIRFVRSEGFIGGVTMKVAYLNNYSSSNAAYLSKIYEELNVTGNLYAQYSHQLNLDSQIDFAVSVSGGPNIIKNPDAKQFYSMSFRMAYSYELTDRIVTAIENNFNVTFRNRVSQQKDLSDNLRLSMTYFVEDQIAMTASYNWQYTDSKYYDGYKHSSNENNIQIGLTYFIDRAFLY